jgi:NAD(P)-dependent dehydrogenase (short-subunit alcohol dehydrogenase family)
LAVRLVTEGQYPPLFLPCDLTQLEALPGVIARAASAIGPIRVLVNNAAHDERHAVEEVTPTFWRDRLAVNLDHHFFCAQAVVPGMRAAHGGAIISLGSCSWHLGLGGMPAYVTAKAAIEGLVRGLARDLGPYGIRVTCVVPGFVRTARQVEKWLTPELERTVLDGQCLKTLIEPDAVAAMVAFLASDDARFCTGQSYAVDAGWM